MSRVLDLGWRGYLQSLRLGLDGSLAMVAVLLPFQHFVAQDWPTWLRLASTVVLGAIAFAVPTFLIHGERLRGILAWLRRVRSGEAA